MERELADLEAQGAEAVQSAAYAALRDRFEAADGYRLDQRVEEALAGLGVPGSAGTARRPGSPAASRPASPWLAC